MEEKSPDDSAKGSTGEAVDDQQFDSSSATQVCTPESSDSGTTAVNTDIIRSRVPRVKLRPALASRLRAIDRLRATANPKTGTRATGSTKRAKANKTSNMEFYSKVVDCMLGQAAKLDVEDKATIKMMMKPDNEEGIKQFIAFVRVLVLEDVEKSCDFSPLQATVFEKILKKVGANKTALNDATNIADHESGGTSQGNVATEGTEETYSEDYGVMNEPGWTEAQGLGPQGEGIKQPNALGAGFQRDTGPNGLLFNQKQAIMKAIGSKTVDSNGVVRKGPYKPKHPVNVAQAPQPHDHDGWTHTTPSVNEQENSGMDEWAAAEKMAETSTQDKATNNKEPIPLDVYLRMQELRRPEIEREQERKARELAGRYW